MLRICNRINNDSLKICDSYWQIMLICWTLPIVWLYLIYLTLWELPIFLLTIIVLTDFMLFFYVVVSGMSWDETLALPVIYILRPIAEDQVVTSRWKRFVKLSQQQQSRSGCGCTEKSLLLCRQWIWNPEKD
jgi:hypothetical protein